MAAEILAPAGGYDALVAAVRCGANAVYLGGKALNARRNASNFSDEELREAVAYCHARNVKVYLTASSACRAKRRYDELTEKGETCDLAAIEADIIERDKRDMEREFAPLRQAEDATYVDSSDMTIDEVITAITDLIH